MRAEGLFTLTVCLRRKASKLAVEFGSAVKHRRLHSKTPNIAVTYCLGAHAARGLIIGLMVKVLTGYSHWLFIIEEVTYCLAPHAVPKPHHLANSMMGTRAGQSIWPAPNRRKRSRVFPLGTPFVLINAAKRP